MTDTRKVPWHLETVPSRLLETAIDDVHKIFVEGKLDEPCRPRMDLHMPTWIDFEEDVEDSVICGCCVAGSVLLGQGYIDINNQVDAERFNTEGFESLGGDDPEPLSISGQTVADFVRIRCRAVDHIRVAQLLSGIKHDLGIDLNKEQTEGLHTLMSEMCEDADVPDSGACAANPFHANTTFYSGDPGIKRGIQYYRGKVIPRLRELGL